MIIGSPKGLGDMPTFCAAELEELFKGMSAYVASGVPMEIPAAIPIGQLGRIVATLQRYHALVDKVAHVEAGIETPGMEQIEEAWSKVQKEALVLLSAPPPVQPKVTPASRLIIPK